MKILHTADWHLGQLFHEYDRTYEHQQFLNWLIQTLKEEQIDVLLISGDVFDLSNPAAASVRMFYSFLNKATGSNPDLQIIITAGNHDSATRLESPKPLLESTNIHIIGVVERDETNKIDYDKLVIPIQDKTGTIKAFCMAIPFLRMGDYPSVTESANSYTDGVTAMYQEVYNHAFSKKDNGQAIIAMGHLLAYDAEVTDLDKSERLIMGGVECISAAAFNEDIQYVALGHLHKAQRIGGKEHIRYSGSPIPMSFSELNYKHQVIVFEIAEDNITNLKTLEVPLSIPLQRIPLTHKPLEEVLSLLDQLPLTETEEELAPYLEVRVLLNGPEPALRNKIETILNGRKVRLAKIDVKYPTSAESDTAIENNTQDKLNELQPLDVFSRIYQSKYKTSVPQEVMNLFNQVSSQVNNKEN